VKSISSRSSTVLPGRVVVFILAFILAAPFLSAPPASAFAPRRAEEPDRRIIPRESFEALPEAAPEGGTGPAAAPAAAFRARHPGDWRLTFDRRTGRPLLFEGRGIPFLPGSGNGLAAAAFGLPAAPRSLDEADAPGRRLIDAEADLLQPVAGTLVLNRGRSLFSDDGEVVFLDYDWVVDGVPVEGARVFLRANHGNVVQMGTIGIGAGLPPANPRLSADEALDRLFDQAGGRRDGDTVIEPGQLLYLPRAAGGASVPWAGGAAWRLAWRASFRRAGEEATWTGDVDARSGEVLSFDDANRYARVTGGVHPRDPHDAEVVRPLTNVRIYTSPGSANTGDAGTFTYSSGPAFTALDGTFFRILCSGCDTPNRAFAFTNQGTGDLELGTGGVDQIGNGASTQADRDAFFHQNRVRALAKKYLTVTWLDSTVTSTVNEDDVCNAFWDGSTTNFFRSGGGCNNTGTIADVMYHEWGHGLDQNTNLGDGGTGEATGDITAMHVTHDSRIGPYFDVFGSPVRDVESSHVGYVARPSTLPTYCLICAPGQCTNGAAYGYEVHCEGEIYGQTEWDLAKALVAKLGFNTGWQTLERIYFTSMPQSNTMVPTSAQSAYSAYLAVDDDNGNLADGTPHCREIYDAFNTHGIAGTPCAADSPPCSPPAQPTLTPTPGHNKVVLDWTASAGAASYVVLRADFAPDQAYIALGTVTTGTHFEDLTVQPGVTYWYVIEAHNATGCRSTIENAVAGSALPDARPYLASIGVDDVPAGNRSGYADPGESIDLTLALRNASPAGDATSVQGALTTPNSSVTVTNGAANYGAVPAGATANGTAYRAALATGLTCGDSIPFTLSITDGGGGAATTASFPVLIGQRSSVRYFEDFEGASPGWTTSAGSPAATQGLWVTGDPNGTSWQPENDADPAGSRCLFTGLNTADSTGDVDGGETVTTSPIIDLSGATAARLSYRRWWASSQLTDTTDTFIVEVSGNGGSTWVVADSVNATARNLGFQPVEVRLESLVPLNSTFRMRARVKDGGADTNVEAAIDDVKIEIVTCDLTPPCFIAPTFAGLATAGPGASCAETDLAWSAATTHCQNAQMSYDVYRSTTPGFTPGPSTLVTQHLPGLAFHDTLLQPGVTYYYVVRADDSRSGQDANTLARSVGAPGVPDTVAPIFPGLGSISTGSLCGETSLQWSAAAETCSVPVRYNVYRSTSAGFAPGPSTLVASILGTSYHDTALQPDQTYYYVVRAADARANEEANVVKASAPARNLPHILYHQDFESGAGGWGLISPNTAPTGLWELGDPQATIAQPEDDATPAPGVNAWVTGLAAGSGAGSFDVDSGVTTLASPALDLTGQPSPILQMSLFYSNDLGANPGEDALLVDVSGNGGTTWTPVLNTLADIPPWTARQFPLAGVVPLNNQFRVRVTAQDLGVGGSLVEAGVDEVSLFQPGTGCTLCSGAVAGVGTILVTRSGDDIVIDWSADPINAPAYNVYLRSGPGFATLLRAGSTTAKSFVHSQAALLTGENFSYEVTAVDVCGRESPAP
jgi:Zn-dependent metalloprotease